MNNALPPHLLTRLSEFVAERMGLHFPPERFDDLERGVRAAAPEFGYGERELSECAEWLLGTPLTREQIQILARDLTIGETYFLREKNTWDALSERILPELIAARRGREQRLRFWSAGCCTGEEPYSLAILLRRAIPDLKHWHVTILATDLNPTFLHKAALGVYGEWSFRDAPAWLRHECFRRNPSGHWEILAEFKRMVEFFNLNLAEDPYPSLDNDTNAMDVILCRNVLMYFASDAARKAGVKFHHALVPGGWLLVSPSEASQALLPQFAPVNLPGAILFQKAAEPAVPAPIPPANDERNTSPPVEPPPCPPEPTGPALYAAALSLYEEGSYAEAVARLAEFCQRRPLEPRSCMLLARTLANQGQLGDALGWCDQAIAADRLSPAAHYLRATILQEQGQLGEAVHALKRAIYLDSQFVLAHFDLGNLALKQGHPKEARRQMEFALGLLRRCHAEDPVPEAEGLTAGRLAEIIESQIESEVLA